MSERLRVYELARELGLSSGELLELLHGEGIEAKSHASSMDEETADLVRQHVMSQRREEAAVREVDAEVDAEAEVAGAVEEVEEAEEDLEDEEGPEPGGKEIHLKPPVVVRDLAAALGKKPNEVIGQLMMMNVFASITQVVEVDVVEKVCERYGYTFVRERRVRQKEKGAAKPKREETPTPKKPAGAMAPRPPVVTFLGHVDHGKTSLQDAIRETKITSGEAGGITQHIGASTVVHEGRLITFLDTPGHEAFTAMRARGANATDIAVVVVAADDGVMPQTIEAINHARAAGVPIVVAMNKMDLPGADPNKVMIGLQREELTPEEWGGEVGVVPVSAETGLGLDDLLERILLESEMLELQAAPNQPGEGLIIEARLEQGMGPVANVLVRNGTVHLGDAVLSGSHYGRVKALINDKGDRVKSAGPSMPVQVLGLSGVPDAGETITAMKNEREAKTLAEERASEVRQDHLSVPQHRSLEDLFEQMKQDSMVELPLVIKADVRGSAEAILDSLEKMKSEKIRLKILHSGVGEITENDVLLAAASNAVMVGFHVRIMPGVSKVAKANGVEIRLYTVIYELLNDIEDAMIGRLEPETREKHLGKAEILQVFNITKTGKICGCGVLEGVMRVGGGARVHRGDDVLYQGTIVSLKHFQDDVREVRAGMECGIRLDNFEDFDEGDRVECFEIQKVKPEL